MTTPPTTRASLRTAAARTRRIVSYLVSGEFWAYAVERAVKTFAQAFAATAFVDGYAVGLEHIAWLSALSIGGGAAVLSLATSLGNYSRPPAPEDGPAAA